MGTRMGSWRVHQAFYGQKQALQALCLECHRSKTFLDSSHAPSSESRLCRHVHETYACSARLPPLVCGLAKCDPDRVCQGVNALANAPFPLPVFCPLDNIRPAEEGRLADLTFVRKKEDRRAGLVGRLPYVGPGWYGKPATSFMLDTGLASWADFEWSLDVSPDCLARWRSWRGPGPRARSTWPSSPSTLSSDSGPVQGRLLQHANVQSRGGRPGLPVPAGLLRRPGPVPLRPRLRHGALLQPLPCGPPTIS